MSQYDLGEAHDIRHARDIALGYESEKIPLCNLSVGQRFKWTRRSTCLVVKLVDSLDLSFAGVVLKNAIYVMREDTYEVFPLNDSYRVERIEE